MAGFVDKFKRMWDAPDEEYEYDEYGYGDNDEAEAQEERYETRSSQRNKVININATAKLAVALFKPERFGEETRAIADELLKTHTVVLNLENTNRDMSRRIIDFLSGVAYANGGKIKKVASSTFIIIPNNVDLTGDDLLDELENNGVYF
ncbi:MAG: cell division protein SepF [Clostridia bacterium]|nr:cell division protein SepF [Clostridia bacterium]